MKFETYIPCAVLRPFVKRLVISETDGAGLYRVLPDTGLVMGFQYRGRLSVVEKEAVQPLAPAGITGLMDGYRIFSNEPDTATVLVVFREMGAANFIRQPLHELFGESLSLEYFFSAQAIRDIRERLGAAVDDAERIGMVEDFLIGHLNGRAADLLVSKALEYIYRSKGTIRIRDLASILYTSQSPLEKRFRAVTGASPKKLATIVRVRNMMEAVQGGDTRGMDYLEAYYDQAHFIKEFKKFTGMTPDEYTRSLRK